MDNHNGFPSGNQTNIYGMEYQFWFIKLLSKNLPCYIQKTGCMFKQQCIRKLPFCLGFRELKSNISGKHKVIEVAVEI